LKKTYRCYEKEYQKNITEFTHLNKLKLKSWISIRNSQINSFLFFSSNI
jgi:hypothetical protein